MTVGIDRIRFYTSHYVVHLADVAEARGLPAARLTTAIGQEAMSVTPPGEDTVTLAANAGELALDGIDRERVGMLVVGTESGVDQSKASAAWVHGLLRLSSRCRLYEVKQACYGGTAGLQAGLDYLARHPDRLALVIAADVARYGLGSAGEATQGAGAVALLLSARPTLLSIDPDSGLYTEDVMDFWRPNYRDEALVDGKASVRVYLRSLSEAFAHYVEQTGRSFADFAAFCYHLPFTRMGETAHKHLVKSLGVNLDADAAAAQVEPSLLYNRITGNSYAASLYIGLCSLLENGTADLTGQRLGLFSYGSGCMAEFFSGVVQPGYREHLHGAEHQAMLDGRRRLSVADYEAFYSFHAPTDGSDYDYPLHDTGRFRLGALREHRRVYTRLDA